MSGEHINHAYILATRMRDDLDFRHDLAAALMRLSQARAPSPQDHFSVCANDVANLIRTHLEEQTDVDA